MLVRMRTVAFCTCTAFSRAWKMGNCSLVALMMLQPWQPVNGVQPLHEENPVAAHVSWPEQQHDVHYAGTRYEPGVPISMVPPMETLLMRSVRVPMLWSGEKKGVTVTVLSAYTGSNRVVYVVVCGRTAGHTLSPPACLSSRHSGHATPGTACHTHTWWS